MARDDKPGTGRRRRNHDSQSTDRRPARPRRRGPPAAASERPHPGLADGPRLRTSADVAAGRLGRLEGDRALAELLGHTLEHRGGDLDRYTHRFHTYPARLHPDAARDLLAALPATRVLDPFCGGGTLLVEAMVAGRQAFGRDINPVAVLVATARTRLLDPARCRELEALATRLARDAFTTARTSRRIPLPPGVQRLQDWYGREPLAELGALQALIRRTDEPLRLILRAAHSSLVIKYSHRASDTSNRKLETRRPPGAVTRAFVARVRELRAQLTALRQAVPSGTPEADVRTADARDPSGLGVDLVVTSPPYPATYDYLPLQQLRLAWLGLDTANDQAAREIGSRRAFHEPREALAAWRRDTAAWMKSAASALNPGGHLAIIIGDGLARGRLVEARQPTCEAAAEAGLLLVAAASIGRRDQGSGLDKWEHALCFTRPATPP